MRLNSFKFWFYSSFHSRLNTAAHPSLLFHSIMYLLPSQIGLISITLPQNWINSTLTSLPDPHRQSRFSQSQKNVWGGLCWKCSDYRSCSHVQVCSITSISSLTPPLIHFLDKMNSPPLTVNTGIMENYKRWNQLQKKTVGSSLTAAPVITVPASFQTEISQIKMIPCCIDWYSVVFHGQSQ